MRAGRPMAAAATAALQGGGRLDAAAAVECALAAVELQDCTTRRTVAAALESRAARHPEVGALDAAFQCAATATAVRRHGGAPEPRGGGWFSDPSRAALGT